MKTTTILTGVLTAVSALADTAIVNGIKWTYYVENNTAIVGTTDGENAIPESTTGSITIPTSLGGRPVVGIGWSAFSFCDNLTSVTIPDSVRNVGDFAFVDCDALTSVFIPNSVTNIGNGAFAYCDELTSVSIPGSVTKIGDEAFLLCGSLVEILVSGDNPAYASFDGVLFSKDKKTLVCFPRGKQGHYSIPNGVTRIGDYAFESVRLTSVRVPMGVTDIGDFAFYACFDLNTIMIPASVKNVGEYAFWGCEVKHLMVAETIKTQVSSWSLPSNCQIGVYGETSVFMDEINIPKTWLENASIMIGLSTVDPAIVAMETAANGRPVWECYVADLDPEDPDDDLVADIELVNGLPLVTILKGESANRIYETQGAPTPVGPWGEPDESSRFFRVKVRLPD